MKLESLQTPGLAHVSYMLSSGDEALIVDPRRDVEPWLDRLRHEGVRLRYVLETHRQEDFVLGSAELARRAGARLIGGTYGNASGERFRLGSLQLLGLPSPGHTPESVSYAVFPLETPDLAWALFTGDALFAGATGRTDLQSPDLTADNAGRLYDALQRLLPLGDQALVLPAHGPGSPCGAKIAERQPTTLGIERRTNPVFTEDRATFIRRKVLERLPRPPYFSHVRALNQRGGAPLPDVESVPMLPPEEFRSRSGTGVVIDTREPEAFAGGHLPGSYSIWLGGLSLFAGWVAERDTPVFLVLEAGRDAREALLSLARVGIDRVGGVLAHGISGWRRQGFPLERSGTITPSELSEGGDRVQPLDVRDINEYEAGHLPGAEHVHVGELEARLGRLALRRDLPVVVTCSIGHRSGLATSILLRHGFRDVYNLLGGMTAWKKLELPTEREHPAESSEGPLTSTFEEQLHPM